MRAKAENSPISRPMVSTWRTIVVTDLVKLSWSVCADLAQIFPPQPLRREPDGRQRVLDLVGDAARHLGPGRLALGAHQLGHVVEGQNEAPDLLALQLGREPDEQGSLVAAADHRDLLLDRLVRSLRKASEQRRQLGQDVLDRAAPPGRRRRSPADPWRSDWAGSRGGSESSPMTPAVTPASTASVNRRRSSSCWLAAISSRRWPSSWLVMRLKARESSAISSSASSSGTRAMRSPLRTRLAAAMRRLIGVASWSAKFMPSQTAPKQQQQRHDPEDQRGGDLDAGPLALHAAVLGHHLLRALHVVEHVGIDEPADEQEEVLAHPIEPQQRPHPIVGRARHRHDLALLGPVPGPRARAARPRARCRGPNGPAPARSCRRRWPR